MADRITIARPYARAAFEEARARVGSGDRDAVGHAVLP
jgi:hypothetical protein